MDREKNMISVCVPSRGRPEKCADMVQSLLDNAHWDVDINIYLNQNDQMLDVYKNLIDNKYLHVGDQYFANHGWNLMAEKATCSLLFMNGDAEIMQTKDCTIEFLGIDDENEIIVEIRDIRHNESVDMYLCIDQTINLIEFLQAQVKAYRMKNNPPITSQNIIDEFNKVWGQIKKYE